MTENQPLKTFIIYARDDKEYKNQLLRHLKPLIKNGYLEVWHDGDILPGEDWEKQIKYNLLASELVLVLVSVNSLNSDFIEGDELGTAVERLHKGDTRIVPIIISPCVWRVHKIFNGLQGLPEDMKPVSNWQNQDSAWTNVAESLMTIVEESRAKQDEIAQKEQEIAEKEKLAILAAKQEAEEKAEQAERDRIAQEQQEREIAEQAERDRIAQEQQEHETAEQAERDRIAQEQQESETLEQKRREEEEKKRQAKEAAQKAAAEQARQKQEAERLRRENEAWQVAFSSNTIEAFDDFAAKYPNSPNTREALRLAKALRRSNNSSPVNQNSDSSGNRNKQLIFIGLGIVLAFLLAGIFWPVGGEKPGKTKSDKSTSSKPINDEPADWAQAKAANTFSAYRTYLGDHADGANAETAKRRIREFKASAIPYLEDAERLIKSGKHNKAMPLLHKILEELDPENERAKELMK